MSQKITVLASIKTKPGKENAFRDALATVMHHTHEEKGCLHYSIHQNVDRPDEFATVERWQVRADLDAHMQTPHFTAFAKQMPDLIVAPPKIDVLFQLEEGRHPLSHLEK